MARKKKTKKNKKTKTLKKNKLKAPSKVIEKKSLSQTQDEKPEIKKVKKQATEKKVYNLKDEDSDKILKRAEDIEHNSNQLLNYTNIIKQNSIDVKKDIIEHLWKVIISDNSIDQYESNLMRRICGLIYFPDKECAEIKLKLLNLK